MVKQQELVYACGCSWTQMYARGTSKREAKADKEWAAREACPKCERKKQ